MIVLKCKKCEKVWEYKGKKIPNDKYKQYVTCPKCHNLTELKDSQEEKIGPYEALAKIKKLIDKHEEFIKGGFDEMEGDNELIDGAIIIEKIEQILEEADIPSKYLIIEGLKGL